MKLNQCMEGFWSNVNTHSGNVNTYSGNVNTYSGKCQKTFTFRPEWVFTMNQNRCSRSSRMGVHVAPEYAGGGASVLVDCLCDKGYSNVAVLDISSKALAFAKDRLGDKAKEVTWYEDDVTQFKAPQQYSFWHDRAVFHFLTDLKDRQFYIKTVKQALEISGHLVIAAFAIDGPTQCSGLDIVQYNADKLIAELGDGFKFIEQMDEGHTTPSGKEQLFSYFHFIKK